MTTDSAQAGDETDEVSSNLRLAFDVPVDGYLGSSNERHYRPCPLMEGWDYGRRQLVEEYLRGAVCIVLKFDRLFRPDVNKRDVIGPAHKHITFHTQGDATIRIENIDRRMGCRPHDWHDDGVLVRVVKKLDLVEVFASATGERLAADEEILHPLAGCFYSLARGFETNPAVSGREFEVAILRALIDPDQSPSDVVEGDTKVVDSIASYQGEIARRFLDEMYPDGGFARFRVVLDANSVWFLCDEGFELPFEVADVMIGPTKL